MEDSPERVEDCSDEQSCRHDSQENVKGGVSIHIELPNKSDARSSEEVETGIHEPYHLNPLNTLPLATHNYIVREHAVYLPARCFRASCTDRVHA